MMPRQENSYSLVMCNEFLPRNFPKPAELPQLAQALPKRTLRPMTVLYQSESKEGPGVRGSFGDEDKSMGKPWKIHGLLGFVQFYASNFESMVIIL